MIVVEKAPREELWLVIVDSGTYYFSSKKIAKQYLVSKLGMTQRINGTTTEWLPKGVKEIDAKADDWAFLREWDVHTALERDE